MIENSISVTFEDWVNNKIWDQKTYSDKYVCNDSENYLDFVLQNKMTYDELNKIQDAQNSAYEYMIKYSLHLNEKHFDRETKGSLDLKKVVELKIKAIEKKIDENKQLYYDVILPRKHRGIKIGAKFIIPEEYVAYKENKISDAVNYRHTNYQINIDNKLTSFPTPDQMKYAQMEVSVLWLKWLNNFLEELQLKEKNLLQLIENNKDYERRVLDFHKREKVAGHFLSTTDFVDKEITEFLKMVKKPSDVSVAVNDMPMVTPFNVLDYSSKAYEYLMRGFDLPIKRLIEDARRECEEAKKVQIKQYGKLFAYTPCDGKFETTVLNALKTGVGFALYIKFLKEKISEHSSKKNTPKSSKKKRINIPAKTRALLQKEINSVCPFCPSQDVDHFEIHHIDENPSNSKLENLLMLCPTCHSKVTKGDITNEEVIFKKKVLGSKDGLGSLITLFASEDDFRKEFTKLLSDENSIYYRELKEHWNSYSLINSFPFLNELVNRSLHKSIEFGLLPLISDFVKRHLYYNRETKYLYNQPHIHIHTSEEEGYNLPVFYHIKFIGILYATAIKNKIDIDSVAHFYKNMQSIFSTMIQGMVDNLQAAGIDHTKEYPTNYHWLIAEIFSIENNWLDRFNEEDYFVEASSFLDFIPFNLRLCFSDLYKGVQQNKISKDFLIRKYYYGVLSDYLSITMNDHLRTSIEENVISEIPNEVVEPLFDFCFDEKFAMSYDNFCQGRFRVVHQEESEILTRLRDFLIDNKKI